MSCDYYRLKSPWTSARLEQTGKHYRLTLWEEGANTGSLCCAWEDSVRSLLLSLTDTNKVVMHTYFGGSKRGLEVEEKVILPHRTTLIDEYGNITSVGEVLALQGNGKVR
jgi:hypothetical protein